MPQLPLEHGSDAKNFCRSWELNPYHRAPLRGALTVGPSKWAGKLQSPRSLSTHRNPTQPNQPSPTLFHCHQNYLPSNLFTRVKCLNATPIVQISTCVDRSKRPIPCGSIEQMDVAFRQTGRVRFHRRRQNTCMHMPILPII